MRGVRAAPVCGPRCRILWWRGGNAEGRAGAGTQRMGECSLGRCGWLFIRGYTYINKLTYFNAGKAVASHGDADIYALLLARATRPSARKISHTAVFFAVIFISIIIISNSISSNNIIISSSVSRNQPPELRREIWRCGRRNKWQRARQA